MRDFARIGVVIPALNEEQAIGQVLAAIPDWVDEVVVADNGSTDRTAQVAQAYGVRVVHERRRGYGAACLAGIAALHAPNIVVFLDGDFSDYPGQMASLVDPILAGQADMVIGSRVLGEREAGALTPQARFGNWLSCLLIRAFWKTRYTDLGPFRAIRRQTLQQLDMQDPNYGWTVEMQIKAAQRAVPTLEVPVSYRHRIGTSKVSRTVKGSFLAGVKILWMIFRALLEPRPSRARVARQRLIVFTRYPEPGKTKTRLIPALGPDGAADLHREMIGRCLQAAKDAARRRPAAVTVSFAGGDQERMASWLGPGPDFVPQTQGDLGRRMHDAFVHAFARGIERAVLIGSDCPGIRPEILTAALDALNRCDVVFGPAIDGGYYLIGLRRPVPELFADMPWSTEKVLTETMQRARDLGLSVRLVASLQDVDRPEDLRVWQAVQAHRPAASPERISVIIPTVNEAGRLPIAVRSTCGDPNVEVIVVDGGSTDDTVAVAQATGARVLTVASANRARQMNVGAASATGNILLFLHADTRLPGRYGEHVRSTVREPDTIAGAFPLRLDSNRPGLRIIERLANWRSRRLQMPYGDQAPFVRGEVFRALGGFREMVLMEDFVLMAQLRRLGRVRIADAPAVSSARRWLELGVLRTTLINQAVIAGYLAGASPETLARWYGRS